MEISYGNSKIEKICKNEQRALKKLGNLNNVQNLFKMLAILRNADTLKDVSEAPPPRRHKLTGNLNGLWGIDINKGLRIILKPQIMTNNLSLIDSVEIYKIGDYHK